MASLATAAHAQVNIPAGSGVVVTLDQSVSSKDARTGQRLDGTIAQDVIVNGKVAVPKGSRAQLSVADVEASGRLSGVAKLWLKIDSVEVKGRTYRTANPIESTFATVRLRQRVTKGAGSRKAGLAMVFKLMDSAQRRWRRLDAHELMPLVRAGVQFVDGKQLERKKESITKQQPQPRKVAA
jgi:hypothetical protein